jgi:ribose 5-phosphate isomerase B
MNLGMSETVVIIGSDHGGYVLKEKLKAELLKKGIPVEDVGTDGEGSVDYPDFGAQVAGAVSRGEFARGILICGTGIGMSMVANRFAGVRAALCNDLFTAAMSRRHNDSNILVMGGRVVGEGLAIEILETWLNARFEEGRHLSRILKFDRIDRT